MVESSVCYETWSMKQTSFASLEYAGKKRVTRREKFLSEMQKVVPWQRLLMLLEPYYPAVAASAVLPLAWSACCACTLQQWYALSDEALEDALYDSHAMRQFVGIDLAREQVPDATTLLKFRRLLEQHQLGQAILQQINGHLSEQGLLMREGTMIDATIIAAPSSTKNRTGQRDPEMHQTKKGNQWHFGLKAHIGADSDSGAVHSVHVSAANESDVAHAHHLLHGDERHVYADAGFTGVQKRDEIKAAQQQEKIKADITWHVAERRHKLKAMPEGLIKELTQALERVKAQIRARVEHPFHIVKNLFGHKKARYKGLAQNGAQLAVLFALANVVLLKRPLLALQGTGAP